MRAPINPARHLPHTAHPISDKNVYSFKITGRTDHGVSSYGLYPDILSRSLLRSIFLTISSLITSEDFQANQV